MTPAQIEFYKRLARSLALQFGPNCEIVVHDLETEDMGHSIVVIENGHVSGRKLGDGLAISCSSPCTRMPPKSTTARRTLPRPPMASCSNRRPSTFATTPATPLALWALTLTSRS